MCAILRPGASKRLRSVGIEELHDLKRGIGEKPDQEVPKVTLIA